MLFAALLLQLIVVSSQEECPTLRAMTDKAVALSHPITETRLRTALHVILEYYRPCLVQHVRLISPPTPTPTPIPTSMPAPFKFSYKITESESEHLIKYGYFIARNIMSIEDARKIAESARAVKGLQPAQLGRGKLTWGSGAIRSDTSIFLDNDVEGYDRSLRALSDLLEDIGRQCGAVLGMQLDPSSSENLQLARYGEDGGHYLPHLDAFTNPRKLTLLFYLNEKWQPEDGGELRIYVPQDEDAQDGEGTDIRGSNFRHVDVLPELGTLMVFESRKLWHEVRPAHRERFAITQWLR